MEFINDILISAGLFVRWAAGGLVDGLGMLFHWLGDVVNPVLSPLLSIVNPLSSKLGDVVFSVTSALPIWAELTLYSAILGVIMLIGFRYTSNQAGIAAAKDKIKANLLALKLYKDELHVTFLAQWRLLLAIGKLQRHMLFPVVILTVPMLLALAQLGVHYQWRSLKPGERVLVRVKLDDNTDGVNQVELLASDGVVLESPALVGNDDIVWRVHGQSEGVHQLHFSAGGKTIEKEFIVGAARGGISAVRCRADWTTQLLHPLEAQLPIDQPIRSIEIEYPQRLSWFHGSDNWVIAFFIISMLVALVLAPLFKVRF